MGVGVTSTVEGATPERASGSLVSEQDARVKVRQIMHKNEMNLRNIYRYLLVKLQNSKRFGNKGEKSDGDH